MWAGAGLTPSQISALGWRLASVPTHPLFPLPGSTSLLAGYLCAWAEDLVLPYCLLLQPFLQAQARVACGEGRQAGSNEKRAGSGAGYTLSSQGWGQRNAVRTTRTRWGHGHTETNQGVLQRGKKASELDASQTTGAEWGRVKRDGD